MARKLGVTLLLVAGLVGAGIGLARLSTLFPGVVRPWTPVLFALLFFCFFTWRVLGGISYVRVANRGNLLMQEGRFNEAVEVMKGTASPRAIMVCNNLGWALLCLWRLDESEAAYLKIPKRGAKLSGLTYLGYASLALVSSLKGNPAETEARLAEADKRGTGKTGTATLARAVIAARAARWKDARELLRRYEVTLLGGPVRALADTLSAWAVKNTTGERRHVDPVALFGEGSPAGLKAAWPELVEFVEQAPKA